MIRGVEPLRPLRRDEDTEGGGLSVLSAFRASVIREGVEPLRPLRGMRTLKGVASVASVHSVLQ